MKKIAIDVMGNDNGVKPAVLAAKNFAKNNSEYKLVLVGNEKMIREELDINKTKNIEIVNAKTEIKQTDGILKARNEENSIAISLKLLKEKKVDAVLSSGNSAILLAISQLIVKKMPKVKKPAFMVVLNSIKKDKQVMMMDVGANVRVEEDVLLQWGKIASVFSKEILGVSKPKVALLNIGAEEHKGTEILRNANTLFKKDKKINYQGFVEPRYILNGNIDIFITSGFEGNLILKAMEGAAKSILHILKTGILSKTIYKLAALTLKKVFRNLKNFDYRNIGGAWILGFNGLVVKAHGSSDSLAFTGALNQIKRALDQNALEKFKEALRTNGKN